MKVVYLNRARGEFWSIEELFSTIAAAMPASVQASTLSAPRSGASLHSLLRNMLWSSRILDADILHVTGDIHYTIIGIWRAPSVLTIHDLRFIEGQSGLRRFLFWLLWLYLPCRRATRVTVISEFTKQRLRALVSVPDSKVTVIPDCVNPDFQASPKVALSSPPILLHAGTTPNKNLERLVSACTGQDLELWILGRLNQSQKDLLAQSQLRYREYYDLLRTEVVELYRLCDIVSFVSLYEGFGLPILEAQAVGRPVITSNLAPLNEVAGAGALLVDPESVDAIGKGIQQLLGDSNLRSHLVDKGFENVSKYSAATVASQYYDLYCQTLAPRS